MARLYPSSALPAVALSAFVAVCLSLLLTSTLAVPSHETRMSEVNKRLVFARSNSTVTEACHALTFSDKSSKITYSPFAKAATRHYMSSSAQTPECTVAPATIEDLAQVIKLVGEKRVEFAIQSGGHTGNQGFSSTKGIHITLNGFKQVTFNADSKTVDIGAGNIWDDVYKALSGTGYIVVGGRVSGVGVGGFTFSGGGYSWYTSQYGVTSDTLVSFDAVLPDGTIKKGVTADSDPDLWFALKGGGNQFGVVSNFRLNAFPQTPKVWGGIRTYTADQVPAVLDAVADFSANNTDPKAQIIPTLDYALLGAVEVLILLAFYDGPTPPASVFARFDNAKALTDGWGTKSFMDVVGSAPSELASGNRGLFHSVQLKEFSKSLLDVITSEAKFYAGQALSHSGSLVSYDIEPFAKEYTDRATDAAWPHKQGGLPLNIYFAWSNSADDQFWQRAALDTAGRIRDAAEKEGQDLSQLLLYPNYALATTPLSQMYGGNVGRLSAIAKKNDPQNVMSLTGGFRF